MAALKSRLKQLEDLVKQKQAPNSNSDAGQSEDAGAEQVSGDSDDPASWDLSEPTNGNSMTTATSNFQDPFHSNTSEDTGNAADDVYEEEDGDFDGAAFLLNLPIILPPAPQAWVLLQEYLVDFNKASPLFSQKRLVDLYTDVFSGTPTLDCLQLKAVYSTLAIAYRLRAMSPLASDADNHNAKSFVEQTSAALPRILIARPSVPSSQYLVGIAVVMHGTHNPQGTRCLLAAALRMLLDLSPRGLEYDEEQAARVFWIAFSMDVDLAIRNGQWSSTVFSPPRRYERIQLSEDMGVVPIGQQQFPIFQHRVQLTKIQSRFLQAVGRVRSLGAVSADMVERQKFSASLKSIAAELSAWRLREPFFQTCPESYRHKLHRSDLVHLTVLEGTYFDTLFKVQGALQRIGPFHGSIMLHLSRYRDLDFTNYLGEAVRLLSLFNFLPPGDFAFVWLVIEAVVSAAYVLLNSVLQSPHLAKAKEDLAATAQPRLLLAELVQKHPQKRLAAALAELERLDRQVLAKPDIPTS